MACPEDESQAPCGPQSATSTAHITALTHEELLAQLEQAVQAARRLNAKINVHRAAVRALGEGDPPSHHPTTQQGMPQGMPQLPPPPSPGPGLHSSALAAQEGQGSLPGAPVPWHHTVWSTGGLQPTDSGVQLSALSTSHHLLPADDLSLPTPGVPCTRAHTCTSQSGGGSLGPQLPTSPDAPEALQRRWSHFSELETQHQAALEAQHEEVLSRKEQLHKMKVARLEAQLLDQEERCAEQAARADALALELAAATAKLSALDNKQQHKPTAAAHQEAGNHHLHP